MLSFRIFMSNLISIKSNLRQTVMCAIYFTIVQIAPYFSRICNTFYCNSSNNCHLSWGVFKDTEKGGVIRAPYVSSEWQKLHVRHAQTFKSYSNAFESNEQSIRNRRFVALATCWFLATDHLIVVGSTLSVTYLPNSNEIQLLGFVGHVIVAFINFSLRKMLQHHSQRA